MQLFLEERAYLTAAADELNDFLLSSADSWRLTGPESFPPLTPGYVLFYMKCLAGCSPAEGEIEKIQPTLAKIEEVRMRWKSAWKKRIWQEIPKRMRLWSNYMDGLLLTHEAFHTEYSWSVRWRVMLALLEEEIGEMDQKAIQQLSVLDVQLRTISQKGPFVWDKCLEPVFNQTDFWYLYLRIS